MSNLIIAILAFTVLFLAGLMIAFAVGYYREAVWTRDRKNGTYHLAGLVNYKIKIALVVYAAVVAAATLWLLIVIYTAMRLDEGGEALLFMPPLVAYIMYQCMMSAAKTAARLQTQDYDYEPRLLRRHVEDGQVFVIR
jgi:ABC-type multidrug transport system permease subunit